jgi:hypothetical protein
MVVKIPNNVKDNLSWSVDLERGLTKAEINIVLVLA